MEASEKRELAIAMKLASLFKGHDWQRYHSVSQQKFQSLTLSRARAVLAIADGKFEGD